MNKKKIAVLSLLMIVILVLTSCLLVACNPDSSDDGNDNKTIEATKGLLINNSDFKVIDTTVTTYPRSVTSWTGAKMYSSGSFRDDVTAGIINLEKAVYNANKSRWNDVNDEIYNKLIDGGNRFGDEDEIKNALMIYMPKEGKNSDGNKINGPTAYGYTSTSFTLEKGSYYKVSVDVLTYNIDGENEAERGARIYLSSNTYAEFSGIDTQGEWKTYTMYVETSPASTTSLTLMLGLGKYNSYYTKGLTSGYAFFDNVVLEKIAATEDATPEKQFEAAKTLEKTDSSVTTTTLKVPNGRFDFGSTNISPSGAPNSWALVTGNSGQSDPAPTSLGYNGIIDLSQFAEDYSKYSDEFNLRSGEGQTTSTTYKPASGLSVITNSITDPAVIGNRIGSNVFMLSQQLMTAQGIRSSRSITIEKNKVYALSVDIYTFGIHGAGVSLILTGSDGKDIVIEGISSQKTHNLFIGATTIAPETGYTLSNSIGASTEGWKTYTFYIKGNQFRDYNYNMAIWLGTKGTNDNVSARYRNFKTGSSSTSGPNATTYYADGTFSNGWVFIDELTIDDTLGSLPSEDDNIKLADNQKFDCTDRQNVTGVIVDLTTENMFGKEDGYMLSDAKATGTTSAPHIAGVTAIDKGAPSGWLTNFDVNDESNPIIANTISEGIVNIANEDVFKGPEGTYPGMPYDMVSTNAYMIHANAESYYETETAPFSIEANQFYRISVWIKTVDISSSSGAYVYLIDKDNDDADLTSFTKISTDDIDSYLNDWCELTIVVRGANDKATNVALKFTLGTGDRWASSTLTSGSMFVTNMNMSAITYANFNDTTTGTYVKSVDMSESISYQFKNGSFDDYDLDDENLVANKPLSEQSVAAKPDEWTINDNTIDINGKNDTPLFAGVIALNPTDSKLDFETSKQAHDVTGIADSTFNNFYHNDGQYSKEYLDSLAGTNMLAIGSKDATKKYAIGFASASVTLSANTYYQLSVYAKTVGTTTASIFLTGESSASTTNVNSFTIPGTSDNGKWTKYSFFIEVGNTSVSIKLNLWLGQDKEYVDIDEDEAKSSGAVFFDKVNYNTIEEDEYNNATADDSNKKISFLTDSFDSLSSTIESRSTLTSPNGWSGSALGNQSTSNSKVGVVYADSNFYETETVDTVAYSRLLGLDYKLEDVTVSDEEITEARKDPQYAEMEQDELVTALTNKKFVDQKKDNWIPVNELTAHSGQRMLVINNTQNSAYRYTSSSNTLKANSFYMVSVFVRTYGLNGKDGDDTIGASIELYLGSADESDHPLIFEKIDTQKKNENGETISNDWTEYRFYIQTRDDDVTSVTVRLALGSHSTKEVDGETVVNGLTRGYAMFDDVTISKIDEPTYVGATENDNTKKRLVAAETSGTPTEPGNNETPSNQFNLEYLWWMIPSIVIGLAIIIVVIIFIIRKLRKPVAKKVAKKESAPANAEMLDKKRNRYDEGKE